MTPRVTVVVRPWLPRAIAAVALSVALLLGLAGCALVLSFDYDTSIATLDAGPTEDPDHGEAIRSDADVTLYAVGGTVDGADRGVPITVRVNGASQALGDGPFSFPAVVADGGDYTVTVDADAVYACTVERGRGTVRHADVTDVAVHCISADAALESLSVSAAPLSPLFEPALRVYTVGPVAVSLSGAAPTATVTATPKDARAKIAVDGTELAAGTPSSPITLKAGATPVDVRVTAVDGTVVHYALSILGANTEYVKPSNTHNNAKFGASIALSTDTLVVGASDDKTSALGDGGPGGPFTSDGQGSALVFTHASGAWSQQAFLHSSSNRGSAFGSSVALSGETVAIGAPYDSSHATGVGGNPNDSSAQTSGAVFVFTRSGATWTQQAYVKASNTRPGAHFGYAVALDGDTLAVGAIDESSNATGIDGDESSTSAFGAGAVYVFVRTDTTWTQQAYIKASNTRADAKFGTAIALHGDTLVVGSPGESSNARGVDGDAADTSMPNAGAVYVFTRSGSTWSQQAYVKASNTTRDYHFGDAVALEYDTMVVGSFGEASSAKGVGGNQADKTALYAGAAYVFTRFGTWSQTAYLKASNTHEHAWFGKSVTVRGPIVVVGARQEGSNATGIGGNENDASLSVAGAAYVFERSGPTFVQQAYVKATNTKSYAAFGISVAYRGGVLAVGAEGESSSATGLNGDQTNVAAPSSGAAYLYYF